MSVTEYVLCFGPRLTTGKTRRGEPRSGKLQGKPAREDLDGLNRVALGVYESAAGARYREALRRSRGRGRKFRAASEPSLAERMEHFCTRLGEVATELRQASLSGRLHESDGGGTSLVAEKLADVTTLAMDVVVGEGVVECWNRAVALRCVALRCERLGTSSSPR